MSLGQSGYTACMTMSQLRMSPVYTLCSLAFPFPCNGHLGGRAEGRNEATVKILPG